VNLSGKITVWGGHNVIFQDCDENVTSPTGDWAADFQNQTGTLWIHDVHFDGVHLTGGIQLQEPGATVVLRDVLFDQVNGSYSTNHAGCIQTWSGPAQFLIDGLTCNSTYQGLFLLPNQYGGTTPTDWDFRNIDIHGDGAYDLWLGDVGPNGEGQLPDFNVQNVYDCDPTNPRTYDGTSDGGAAWAAVQDCPTPAGSAFVSATSYGATGPDDAAYQDTITGDDPAFYWQLNDTAGATATAAGIANGSTAPDDGPIATDARSTSTLERRRSRRRTPTQPRTSTRRLLLLERRRASPEANASRRGVSGVSDALGLDQAGGNLAAAAAEAAHDRALLGAERPGRVPVGQADHIDGENRLAQWLAELAQRLVDRRDLDRVADRVTVARDLLDLLPGVGDGGDARRASRADPGVAHHPEQIGQIAVPAHKPRPAEHPLIGVLDEVLGVLTRPAQPVGGPVEPGHVVSERIGVELPRRLVSCFNADVRGSHSINPDAILATERGSHIG